jgi:DNA primase
MPKRKPMTIHLQRFVDRVRGAEARGAKDFNMSMQDAKDLHADVTRLLLDLHALKETVANKTNSDSVITVDINGGDF